jgi:malonate transporter and related proteins
LDAILNTVVPVFGLIILGYGLAKAGIIDAAAGRGISAFVFNVAIPAFLFRTLVTMETLTAAPWSLWLAFYGGLAIAWGTAAFVSRHVESLNVSGGAAASMATGFGNLALLGTPLALAHFGPEVGAPLGLIISVHAPILWFAATLHRELARREAGFSIADTAVTMLKMLASNGIVIGLAAGGLWRLTGLGLHPLPGRMLDLLSDASIPTALIALGVSLSAYSLRGSFSGMFTVLALKMVVMPICVFVIARYVVDLPPLWLKVAVLFASMPPGANAFLFAQRNDESVAAVSGAVALGTGIGIFSSAMLLWMFDHGVI